MPQGLAQRTRQKDEKMTNDTTPRIYVACLAAYNHGHLHGAWIDAGDADDMHDAVQKMLAASPIDDAEEFAIHDHEGLGDLIGEYTPLDKVAQIVIFLDEHEEYGQDLISYFCGNFEDAEKCAAEYIGHYENAENFAAEMTEGAAAENLPSWLENYIDWDRMGEDMKHDYITIDDGKRGFYAFANW
jgi:antirestriction protein